MDHAGTGWVTTGHRRPCYSCYSLHLLLLLLLLLHPHHLLRGAKHCKFQDFVPTSQTPGALKHHKLNISNLFCVSEYFSIFFVKKKISFIIFLDNSKTSFVFKIETEDSLDGDEIPPFSLILWCVAMYGMGESFLSFHN